MIRTILFNNVYSYVNHEIVKKLASQPNEMNIQLCVTALLGSVYHTNVIFMNYTINVNMRILSANLVQLGIKGYDTVLEMDWLAKFKVTIYYVKKLIGFPSREGGRLEFSRSNH